MLAPWKKSYNHSIFKSRDITLPKKIHLVKAMVYPVVMYGCESWTTKKAEHQRTNAFELWCWRSLLRVLWTARRSNKSILKDISSEYPLEGLMLNLKLQCFGHQIWRANSLSVSPSPHTVNLSQHQGLFQWVSSSHQVAKVLKLQLQQKSFQWIFRTDL